MIKLTETDEYMLNKLSDKFDKKEFSIEEAREYLKTDEHFTNKDFSTSWQKLFTLDENTYITMVSTNPEKFILLHKALLYKSKEFLKERWTHSEIISIISVCSTIIITLLNLIFK